MKHKPKLYHRLALPLSLAAETLGLRRAEIFAAAAAGEFPVYAVGVRKRVFTRDLLRWARKKWRRL